MVMDYLGPSLGIETLGMVWDALGHREWEGLTSQKVVVVVGIDKFAAHL